MKRALSDDRPEVTYDYTKQYGEIAGSLKFHGELLERLPTSLRFALTSGFTEPSHGGLRLSVCLKEANKIVHSSRQPPVGINAHAYVSLWAWSEDTFTFDFRVSYLKDGEWKEISLFNLSGMRKYPDLGPMDYRAFFNGPNENAGSPQEIFLPEQYKQLLFKEDRLSVFEADFRDLLNRARDDADQQIESQMIGMEHATTLARESLAFVIERGLADSTSATRELRASIASPKNLPGAQEWARAQFEGDLSRDQMEFLLKNQTSRIRALLDEVEKAGNLQAPADLFSGRLKKLGVGR
ncbi:MAG: hypothetical protein EOP06_27480 [Proteobacteria bacterium]|nr:MAG: hypothetical protein EOP06_27480 [Pseudomonadota bacterium]